MIRKITQPLKDSGSALRLSGMTILLGMLFISSSAFANLFGNNDAEALLPAEEAFVLSTEMRDGSIHANWFIADQYYLYKHQFKFTALTDGVVLGEPHIPAGKAKTDAVFGDVEVYYHSVDIQIPVLKAPDGPFEIELRNQGCAEIGLCYPPQKHQLSFTLTSAAAATATPNSGDNSSELADLLNRSPLWAILVFAGLGVLLSFNPCSYPMYPILSRIIVGQGSDITRSKGVSLSLAYVIPMAAMYAIAGALIALAGQNLFAAFQGPLWLGTVIAILLLLSLSMFGFYELQLPASLQTKLNNISENQQSGSHLGAAIMGALSALVVGACVLPPLTAALLFISQSGNVALGAAAMFAFGLGMGVPLVAIGFSAGWLLPKAGAWMEGIKRIFGVLLIAAAIYIASRLLADHVTLALWGLLLMGCGLGLGALTFNQQGLALMRQLLGIVLLLWGTMALFGAAQGNDDLFKPLAKSGQQTVADHKSQWLTASNTAELKALLQQHPQAMVDIYADWCIPCKVMEKTVFPDPAVQAALAGRALIQVDVTANNEADKQLKAAFNIINPPTVMFFDSGIELSSRRVTGEVNAAEFLQHLQSF
jgi:thiol:disulfide interchange protein DsbD